MGSASLVKTEEDLAAFGRGQQWQRVDAVIRVCHDALQYCLEVSGHSLDGRSVEQVRVEFHPTV